MRTVTVPPGEWMRFRSRGRYVYAKNQNPIVWQSNPPPKGTPVYYLKWGNSQNRFTSSRVVVEV